MTDKLAKWLLIIGATWGLSWAAGALGVMLAYWIATNPNAAYNLPPAAAFTAIMVASFGLLLMVAGLIVEAILAKGPTNG